MLVKNKLYLVLNPENHDVEYTILSPFDEDIFVMRRSHSSAWSDHVRDEVIMTVFNTGDGYRIKWEEKTGKVLDYSQIAELTIMLNFINHNSTIPSKYTIIDADDIVDIV
jgi:hypothetical protein